MNKYQAVVAGAGPAGIATVATLLDFAKKPFQLVWVDPEFNAGRLSSYSEVPSNTKVNLFIQFVTTSPTLNAIAEERKSLVDLQKLPGDKGCPLHYVSRLCRDLSDGLRKHPQIKDQQGTIKSVTRRGGGWVVCFAESQTIAEAEAVYLCTGSVPRKYPSSAQELPLLTALKPSDLCQSIPAESAVVVVGNSHSAILVLKNLYELEKRPVKVIHYARHPLKYAQFMEGWILYDNTGLKGVAADWAKEILDKETVDWPGYSRVSDDASFLDELRQANETMKSVYTVGAIGFVRDAIPEIVVKGPLDNVRHNRATGQLQGEREDLPGLFGFGIAFPELWTDPYGNQENHVGLWKFMKYIRRVIPEHLSAITSQRT